MKASTEEILSEKEIEARYPDQWVLVDILEWDAELEITRGIVRATGAEKSPLYQAARQLPAPRKFSVFFTGERPKNQGYLLNYGLFY